MVRSGWAVSMASWSPSTAPSRLSQFDGVNWGTATPQSISGGKAANPMSLGADSSGNVWIGLQDVGLIRWDGTNAYVFNDTNSGLVTNRVKSVVYDKKS